MYGDYLLDAHEFVAVMTSGTTNDYKIITVDFQKYFASFSWKSLHDHYNKEECQGMLVNEI